MARREGDPGRIGETLEAARASAGLDLRAVEERTKIRIKYLRALEQEEWEVLPGPAYAIGFLRTYAQLIGLDADELGERLRRRLEPEAPGSERRYPLGEPVLSGRVRGGGGGRRIRVAVVVLALVLALIVALVLTGLLGDDERQKPVAADGREESGHRGTGQSGANGAAQEESFGPVRLHLILRSDVPVCLLGDGSRPLVDNQVLNAGSEEEFEAERFELRFPEGFDRPQLELRLDGERTRLEDPQGPAAFKIASPDRVKPTAIPGEDCP